MWRERRMQPEGRVMKTVLAIVMTRIGRSSRWGESSRELVPAPARDRTPAGCGLGGWD